SEFETGSRQPPRWGRIGLALKRSSLRVAGQAALRCTSKCPGGCRYVAERGHRRERSAARLGENRSACGGDSRPCVVGALAKPRAGCDPEGRDYERSPGGGERRIPRGR